MLDEKDKDYEKRIRALRQEVERVKEESSGNKNTAESKRIAELEKEIDTVKQYYNKRIRELEDKYKFKVPEKDKKNAGKAPLPKNADTLSPEVEQLKDKIEQITKERNMLAQKVVNLETQNIKRRNSLSGQQPNESSPELKRI